MTLKTEFSSSGSCHSKYRAFNQSAPGADTAIISGGLTFSESAAACRVTVALTTSSVFNVTCTDGSTTHKWGLNASAALNAADLYTFTFAVAASDDGTSGGTALTWNFEVESDGVIEYLAVDEVKGGVL